VPGFVSTSHSLAALRVRLKTARTMPLSANSHQVAVPANVQAADRESADTLCTCGHPRDQHDSISTRYCDATASAGLDRGCVCHAVPGAYPGRM
jgi:hypothetical protein